MKPVIHFVVVSAMLSASALAERVLRDEIGREVKVPDHPHRLVCLAPNITDMVYDLGRGDNIIGITDQTKYPPQAHEKPSVGGVINPSVEKVIALHPDLVLAIGDLNPAEVVRAIEHLGLPVFVIRPHGLHDIYRSIEDIGNAIDARPQAAALISRLQAQEAAVRQRVAGRPQPTILFLLWPDPIMSAGHGAFITEIIEAAGGKSVTANISTEWPQVSLESVLAAQPEYLLLVRGSDATLETLRRQGNWMRLNAVRLGKVFYTDDRIELPSARAFDALEDLANQFHPGNKTPAGR